ncbi:hypothetical protein GCM10023171_06940 [Microbacterium panaciterrae]|uniref:Uncharacterized protein n=2 Tax=Microbacterium panaciterrae TaxID=985759 RepID=A0ABP8P510_9MICO
MFLLGIIALALLPALMNGLRYSAQQSTVATATRQVNGLVDQVRQNPVCGTIGSIVGTSAIPRSFADGRGQTFTTQATIGSCSAGSVVSLHITALQGSVTLATADALVMIPPNPVTVP